MSRLSPRFSMFLGGALCAGALVIAGCGGPSPSLDATCGDFGKMSEDDQKETTQLVLKDNGVSTDGLGAGAEIAAGRAALKAYCAASGDTAKVRNVTEIGEAAKSITEALESDGDTGATGATGDTGATGQ